jgi:hypothetical protein
MDCIVIVIICMKKEEVNFQGHLVPNLRVYLILIPVEETGVRAICTMLWKNLNGEMGDQALAMETWVWVLACSRSWSVPCPLAL